MTAGHDTLRVHMTGSEWFTAAPGGLNRYFTELYRALRDHGELAVTATAFGAEPAGARSWGPLGGSTIQRARAAYFDRAPLPGTAILDRHFCLYGPPAKDGGRRIPLVVHFHGPWAAESRLSGQRAAAVRAKYLIERWRYAGAQRYVVLSTQFRNVLIVDYRVPEDRVQVIPPGIHLDGYLGGPVPPGPPTVLCVRRLERRMGIDVLLRGWPQVRAEHPQARLAIVGTGTAERELRSLATSLGDSVEFTGPLGEQQLIARYEQAAVTVVPSRALEGFGLIALESLAAGRAPVVTNCGGLPDSVRGLDQSLIVPAGDADALAARLSTALHGHLPTPAECRAHAAGFSWDVTAARHVAMYRDMTDRESSR